MMLDWSQSFRKKRLHKSCIDLMKEGKFYLHKERLISSDDFLYLKKSLVSLKQKFSKWENLISVISFSLSCIIV